MKYAEICTSCVAITDPTLSSAFWVLCEALPNASSSVIHQISMTSNAVKVICGEHHIGFVPKTVLHEYGARMNLTLPGTVTPMKESWFKYQPVVECRLEGLSQNARLGASPVRDDKVNELLHLGWRAS